MKEELRALLDHHRGVVRRDDACQVLSEWALERACRAGQIRRLLPGVYVDAALAAQPDVVRRAAVRYADGRGVWAPRERVNFELDGGGLARSTEQREADLWRDARLFARGIQVVRFTHRRLYREPDVVRQEVLEILAAARRTDTGRTIRREGDCATR